MMQQMMMTGGLVEPTAVYVDGATGTNSAVLPAHAVGDLIVGFAFHDATDVVPSLGAGFSNVDNGVSGSDEYGWRVGYRIATVTNTASGTWTNADAVAFVIYRNAEIGTDLAAGLSGDFDYPAFSPSVPDGSSLILGMVGYTTGNTNAQTAPTGMTNRQNVSHASDEVSIHESDDGRYIWPATSVVLTGTSGAGIVYMLEIKST